MKVEDIDLPKMEKVTGIPRKKIIFAIEQEDFDEEPKAKNFVEAREEFALSKHDSV